MSSLIRYVAAETSLEIQRRVQYRVNQWIWGIASILQIVISLAVWRAVADANGGSVGGYDAASFIGYFIALLIVRELTYTGTPWALEEWVTTGELAPRLLRPRHPLLHLYGGTTGYRVFSLMIVLPVALALFLGMHGRLDGGGAGVAIALLALPFANVTRMLADSIIGSASLWLVRNSGIRDAYYLTMFFLSGQFAPLDVLPGWMQTVTYCFPFYWTLGFPVELAVGRVDVADAWIGFAALGAWLLALWVVLHLVWSRGVRAYEAVGQ